MKRNSSTSTAGMLLLLFFSTGMFPLLAQVSHGGHPVMNDSDFDPAAVIYLLPPEDPELVAGLRAAHLNRAAKAIPFATERPVDLSPEYNGQWTFRENTHIWRVHLISPGAFSLGVQFSEFVLTGDAQIFVYDPRGNHIRGSFNRLNNKSYGTFYVGHVPGEEVIVELQTTDPDRRYGELRIGLLSHAFLPVYAQKSTEDTGLGTSQDCEIDVNCREGDDWQILKRSVCHISTTQLLCTGVLVNNTSYRGEPYVLTAEHCINRTYNAENSVFYFGYENSDCGTRDAKKNQSVSGSTLLATGDSIDFTLVELSARPPREYDVYYAGWDARKREHSGTATLHHPNADAMKISFDFDATAVPASVPGDLDDYILSSNFWIRQWDIGSTEGGSSGSPLFNSAGKVIGLLSGGLASCGDSMGYDEVNDRVIYSLDENRDDYFSRLSFGWDYYQEKEKQLMQWLDPTGSQQLFIGGLSTKLVNAPATRFSQQEISFFPNPAPGAFRIELPGYTGKTCTVEIRNAGGALVRTVNRPSVYPITVIAADLHAGLYFVRVHDGDRIYKGKVVLQ